MNTSRINSGTCTLHQEIYLIGGSDMPSIEIFTPSKHSFRLVKLQLPRSILAANSREKWATGVNEAGIVLLSSSWMAALDLATASVRNVTDHLFLPPKYRRKCHRTALQ